MKTNPQTGLKDYYDNPDLNRIANERKWGRVFGEKTMLVIKGECSDEREFIEEIEAKL